MRLGDVRLVEYTEREERINCVSHALGLVLSGAIAVCCLAPAVREKDGLRIVCALLYLLGTSVMFIGSALYHGIKPGDAKRLLRVLDHCFIFFAVAGTATGCVPAVYDTVGKTAAYVMLCAAWAGALFGLAVTLSGFEKHKALQMAVYIATALICAVCGAKAYFKLPIWAFLAFLGGSALLIAGLVIYGAGRTKRYYHCVFHVFILAGLVVYFCGISAYCF